MLVYFANRSQNELFTFYEQKTLDSLQMHQHFANGFRIEVKMEQLNEKLLNTWLQLSTCINNERVVSDLSFNESLICNVLYRYQMQTPDQKLTATDLCQTTKMLKSQMNRTLNSLEKKGLIARERSTQDKRQVFVTLKANQVTVYENQHYKILELVDTIIEQLGVENTKQTIHLLSQITNIANEVLYD